MIYIKSRKEKRKHKKPEIKWEKDGIEIETSDRVRIMHQEKKLFIRNVDSESAGRYTCTIINKAGSDYRNFLVSVYHPPSFDNTQGPFSKTNLIGVTRTLFRKIIKFSNSKK